MEDNGQTSGRIWDSHRRKRIQMKPKSTKPNTLSIYNREDRLEYGEITHNNEIIGAYRTGDEAKPCATTNKNERNEENKTKPKKRQKLMNDNIQNEALMIANNATLNIYWEYIQ